MTVYLKTTLKLKLTPEQRKMRISWALKWKLRLRRNIEAILTFVNKKKFWTLSRHKVFKICQRLHLRLMKYFYLNSNCTVDVMLLRSVHSSCCFTYRKWRFWRKKLFNMLMKWKRQQKYLIPRNYLMNIRLITFWRIMIGQGSYLMMMLAQLIPELIQNIVDDSSVMCWRVASMVSDGQWCTSKNSCGRTWNLWWCRRKC